MDNLYQQLLQEIIMTLDIKDQYYMEFFFCIMSNTRYFMSILHFGYKGNNILVYIIKHNDSLWLRYFTNYDCVNHSTSAFDVNKPGH